MEILFNDLDSIGSSVFKDLKFTDPVDPRIAHRKRRGRPTYEYVITGETELPDAIDFDEELTPATEPFYDAVSLDDLNHDPRDPGPHKLPAHFNDRQMLTVGNSYMENISFPDERPLPTVSVADQGAAEVFFQQAAHSLAEGNLPQAASAYGQGLALDPGHIEAYIAYGEVLAHMGNLDEAILWLVKAVNYTARNAAAWRCLGRCYERRFDQKGEHKDAVLACDAFLLGARSERGDAQFRLDLERVCLKSWGVRQPSL